MNEYPLHKFIDLIQYDQSIVKIEKEKGETERELKKAKHEFDVLQTGLTNVKHHVHEMRKEVDVKEREMSDLDHQEKEKKKKLEDVQSQREYESLKHEIESVRKKQVGLEENLIASWKNYETAQHDLEQKQEFTVKRCAELDQFMTETLRKMAAIDEKIKELMAVRAEKEIGIPAEWLEKYTAMRMKVSNPVVPVQEGSCSACFYRISQKDVHELRKGKLILCRDCFRFLYMEQAMNAPSGDTQES
ncbi:MAG: putative zinc ribbon domain protein [Candidatus Dependentiae bacterium ADurb.Bin331]|nr:MAG: putative zinc ribbon domain protein [Candidatus Dependentiae bacterium ADurb.Bin331]